jgi:hypothetical protein
VKLLRARQDQLFFEIGRREKALLFEMLQLYPLIPVTHHRLSKNADVTEPDDNQRLLEESLAAQREENRKNIQAMLDEPGRFKAAPTGFLLKITRPEVEWLLQVLNDVRVGSWVALGSPDTEAGEEIPLNEKTAPQVRSMEIAGAFESFFLDALMGHTSLE